MGNFCNLGCLSHLPPSRRAPRPKAVCTIPIAPEGKQKSFAIDNVSSRSIFSVLPDGLNNWLLLVMSQSIEAARSEGGHIDGQPLAIPTQLAASAGHPNVSITPLEPTRRHTGPRLVSDTRVGPISALHTGLPDCSEAGCEARQPKLHPNVALSAKCCPSPSAMIFPAFSIGSASCHCPSLPDGLLPGDELVPTAVVDTEPLLSSEPVSLIPSLEVLFHGIYAFLRRGRQAEQ